LAPQAFFFGTTAVFLAFEAARHDLLRDSRVGGQKTPPQMASGALLSPGPADQIQSRPAILAFRGSIAVFWPDDCFHRQTCFENAKMAAQISILFDPRGVFAPQVVNAA
jgi:hypothetical protein